MKVKAPKTNKEPPAATSDFREKKTRNSLMSLHTRRHYIHGTRTGGYKIGTERIGQSSSQYNDKNAMEGLNEGAENVFHKENGRPEKTECQPRRSNSLILERERK